MVVASVCDMSGVGSFAIIGFVAAFVPVIFAMISGFMLFIAVALIVVSGCYAGIGRNYKH